MDSGTVSAENCRGAATFKLQTRIRTQARLVAALHLQRRRVCVTLPETGWNGISGGQDMGLELRKGIFY